MARDVKLAEHRLQIRAWQRAGVPVTEIARRLGCSHQAVRARLAKWDRKAPRKKPSDKRLREMYLDEGKSCSDIAKALGRYTTTVTNWLKRAGVPMRPQRRPHAKGIRGRESELVALYVERELSTQELAQHFGVARSTVSRRLKQLGVKLRPVGAAGTREEVLERLKATATHRARKGWQNRESPVPDTETLREMYEGEHLSSHEIAERVGCSQSAVLERLRAAGVATRCVGLGGVRESVKRRVTRQLAEYQRLARQVRHAGRAVCPRCEREVRQALDASDWYASAYDRLARHLELDHGLHERQAQVAALDAEYVEPRRAS